MQKTFMPLTRITPLFRVFLLIIGFGLPQLPFAQTKDYKATVYQIGLGETYLFDDYLSPLPHHGPSLRLSSGNIKPQKWGLPAHIEASFEEAIWFNQYDFTINTSYGESSTKSSLLYGYVDFQDYIYKQVISANRWKASIGGYLALRGGGRYCSQNGNNPASLDASADFGMTALASYRLKLRNSPIWLRYQGSLDLAGVAFSPEYAESFYEIFYLKNFNNTIKFTSPYNRQNWTQQFSIDIPVSGRMSSIRLSYWNEGRISLMNNIRTRVITNQLSIGYIRYFNIL